MLNRIVPPAGPPRVLALAQLTNSIGDGAYYVCSALYFTRIVGLSPTQVGLGLTLGWAAGGLAGAPIGHLADRLGPRRMTVLLALATGLSIGCFLFVRSFPPFALVACLYATCQCGLAATRQALLAGLVERGRRTETRAYLQSTLNAGLAVGAALGGVALHFDTREAYLVILGMDALAFVASALVVLLLPPVAAAPAPAAGEAALAVVRDRPYALVTFLNAVLLLRMPLLSLVIPLWIVQRTQAPGWMTSALLILKRLAVMLFQVRVARRVTDAPSAARLVGRAGPIMLASCAAFALSALGSSAWVAAGALLGAAVLQVLAEMMQSSGAWELSFELAPAGAQGQYQGFFGTGTAVARMIGPLFLTALVVAWGPSGWLVLGLLFLLSSLAMGPAARWAERSRTPAVPAPARV